MDKQKKIMIVEDDAFVMDIYKLKLTQDGYDVMLAADGSEAVEKLKSAKPNLILLDIQMPKMSGLEVLEKIKKDDNLKNIPVILLTNLSQKAEITKGLELGANDYLIKSHFTPSEVLSKIKMCLENVRK